MIRCYQNTDCSQIADLFDQTVHTINTKDYTSDQLNAWADGHVDLAKWNESFLEHYTLVAIKDHRIVGFGDIDPTGYLDRLEQAYACSKITTHASITAKTFFLPAAISLFAPGR